MQELKLMFKKLQPKRKLDKRYEQAIHRKNIWRKNKRLKRYLTSFVFQKMQMKKTKR